MSVAKQGDNPYQEFFKISFNHPGVAEVAATGLITCTTNANMADTDYITIGDGINVPVLYEYDKSANGVTGGRASWAAGAGSAATVAATLKTAIEANQKAFTVVDNADGTLTLTHKWPGAGGNVTITENVANAAFLVSGMSGGVDPTGQSASITYKLETAQRKMRIDKVEYVNPTGLLQDAANYWDVEILKGATSMAKWSTLTGSNGTLTANTIVNPTLSATDANRVAAVDDVISLALTKHASAANLPAGRVVVHGRYV